MPSTVVVVTTVSVTTSVTISTTTFTGAAMEVVAKKPTAKVK